ncbi:hypothetical protein ACFOLA_04495 [Salinicoccus hispanicus]|uniref:hypothetical protein n=1 Tax=Salinicoccus hispanicus TaxID=157225 RepID=UPI0014785136|nr:hypothetical protein [Salinicoccus hispanicus]
MLTLDSKINQQIAHNLALKGMKVPKEQQKKILEAINSDKEITNQLIRRIAFK